MAWPAQRLTTWPTLYVIRKPQHMSEVAQHRLLVMLVWYVAALTSLPTTRCTL
jgi:hypothetical protein